MIRSTQKSRSVSINVDWPIRNVTCCETNIPRESSSKCSDIDMLRSFVDFISSFEISFAER